MIARIAAGLAMNPAIEHRWRRVAVPITAFLFMLLVLAAASVVLMVQREEARVENRTALLTFDPSPTDLLIAHGVDSWHGNQFAIYWVEPAGGVTPVLPPGMSRLPEPGQSVVSPALDRLANSYPALAARYPHRLILGSEGLRSEDELLAYIRVPEGRSLTQDTPVVAAHAFGSPSGHEPAMQIGLPSPVNFIPVSEGTLGFLIFPGLILLVIGLASASSVRDRRFETLRWLGAPGRMLATLTTVETMLLAVPGLVVAVLLWTMVAPFLGWVPLAGHDVVRGDLALPWWLLAALFVACTVITGIVAVVIAVLGSRGATRLRPSSRRDDISPLRMIPIWLALGMISLGNILRGDIGATMIVGGLVLMVIGVPLIVPVALRALGNALTHSGHLSAMLTGRGIQRDPVRISRVFSAGAALIVILLAGSGYLALVRHTESPPMLKTGPQSAIVQWHDPHPSDPARLANALGEGLVVPVREEDREILVGSTCRSLSTISNGRNAVLLSRSICLPGYSRGLRIGCSSLRIPESKSGSCPGRT